MKIVPSYVITSKKQLAVLSSGVRQEIADVLSQLKRASVSTLAAALGRPADALYYHLRLLEGAGLVNKVGVARKDRRREVLYSAAGSELRIDYGVARREATKHLVAITGAMSRLAVRDVRRALADQTVVLSGPNRALWVKRRTGWLMPSELRRIGTKIEKLGSEMARPVNGAQLYGITIVFTPLKRRRRPLKAARRAAKGNSK
jgi:DNA-binding transcriptional ArsR family regulator